MIDGLYIVQCTAEEFMMMCKITYPLPVQRFCTKLQTLLLADTLYNFNCCFFEGLELQGNVPVPHTAVLGGPLAQP